MVSYLLRLIPDPYVFWRGPIISTKGLRLALVFLCYVAQQDRKVDLIGRVARVRVKDPLQESQSPPSRIGSALVGARDECLSHEIGDEQRDSTRPAVLVRGLHHSAQLAFGGHVADGVVDVHRVEGPAQAQRANVTPDVPALAVELATHLEHLRRHVHQRHLEMGLEVEGAVASARAKLQDGSRRRLGWFAENLGDMGSPQAVLLGIRENRPPSGQLAVELHPPDSVTDPWCYRDRRSPETAATTPRAT